MQGMRTRSRNIQPGRRRVRVRPSGDLDLASVPAVRASAEELIEAGFDAVVLDLSGLEFIDCSGLHLVLDLSARARHDQVALTVVPGPPRVQRLFELTHTETRVPFEPPRMPRRRLARPAALRPRR
jgi:anti-anti-sigma factor